MSSETTLAAGGDDTPIIDDAEKEKMNSAARQSKSFRFFFLGFYKVGVDFIVEFYFADSNLPFDR